MTALHALRLPWVILALLGGAMLVLLTAAVYLDMWKPRAEDAGPGRRGAAGAWAEIPWSLRLVFIAFAVYGVLSIVLRLFPRGGGR